MAALDNASKPSQNLHDSKSNVVPTFMPTPIFQDGANPELFREHRVYNMVSILRTHALIRPDGAKQLVNFLSNLPNPSTIVLVDEINRFNINAFEVRRWGTAYTPKQDDICRRKAIKRANEYEDAIQSEIDALEDEEIKSKIRLIRWANIQDDSYEAKIKIVEKHYQSNPNLKEAIDKIARGFLRLRLPQANNSFDKRLPFMVKYITHELPLVVTGHFFEGHHYSMMVYPTDGNINQSKGNAEANAKTLDDEKPSFRKLCRDVKVSPLFEDLRNELKKAMGGNMSTPGFVNLPLFSPFDGQKEENDEKTSKKTVEKQQLFKRTISQES